MRLASLLLPLALGLAALWADSSETQLHAAHAAYQSGDMPTAIRLYRLIGFRRSKTLYKAVVEPQDVFWVSPTI